MPITLERVAFLSDLSSKDVATAVALKGRSGCLLEVLHAMDREEFLSLIAGCQGFLNRMTVDAYHKAYHDEEAV